MKWITAQLRGFTLIEVLAAMAIIALVLPVAMRAISLATRLGGEARRRSEAAELARLKLDDLISNGPQHRHARRRLRPRSP